MATSHPPHSRGSGLLGPHRLGGDGGGCPKASSIVVLDHGGWRCSRHPDPRYAALRLPRRPGAPLADAEKLVQATEQRARSGAIDAMGVAIEASDRRARWWGRRSSPERRRPHLLKAILRSHAAIHAAEGALYRSVIAAPESSSCACSRCQATSWSSGPPGRSGVHHQVPDLLTRLGRELGPPWTADHKAATLAAILALG
jgi:hypothetical protein